MEQEETAVVTDVIDVFDDDAEDAQKDKYLTFSIGSEDYGIEIEYVTEIVVMQPITQVPDMPEFIKGVINLRGNVISVMDMRTRFNLEQREYDERTCTIVIDVNELQMGLIVDSVKEVMDIPPAQIDQPPRTHSGIKTSYVEGMGKVGDNVKILLNVEKILFEEELEQIQQLATTETAA